MRTTVAERQAAGILGLQAIALLVLAGWALVAGLVAARTVRWR